MLNAMESAGRNHGADRTANPMKGNKLTQVDERFERECSAGCCHAEERGGLRIRSNRARQRKDYDDLEMR
jgi:hypothetical protein